MSKEQAKQRMKNIRKRKEIEFFMDYIVVDDIYKAIDGGIDNEKLGELVRDKFLEMRDELQLLRR
ncbi:hypothetical protein [Priestia megaterium]|uniref:hypothetical protein n=1 Tax=Priestia megaterium TaxID=1404 RepID=UPI0031FCE4F0